MGDLPTDEQLEALQARYLEMEKEESQPLPQEEVDAKLLIAAARHDQTHVEFINHLADLIVWMDQQGLSKADRQIHWDYHGVTKREVEESEETVEKRYAAAKFKRKGRRRRW